MLHLKINLPLRSTVLLNQCPLHWDQINGCSGIGLGLLIGNSFGFLRLEASHWVTAELQATRLPFLTLVYWVVTITMKFQWLLSLCAMESWRQRRMLSFLNIHRLQGWMYQGCSVHSLATLKSKQWKSIILGPSTLFFPQNKGNQIYTSEHECESHWPLWDVLLISKL